VFEGLLGKGVYKMVNMYYKLAKAGLRTIQNVPHQYRDAVMADLTALELDENGNLIPPPTVFNVTVDDVSDVDTPLDLSGKNMVIVRLSAVLSILSCCGVIELKERQNNGSHSYV